MLAKLYVEVGTDLDPTPYRKASLYRVICDKYGDRIVPQYHVVWTLPPAHHSRPARNHSVRLLPIGVVSRGTLYGYGGRIEVDSKGRPSAPYNPPHPTSSPIRAETLLPKPTTTNLVYFSLVLPMMDVLEVTPSSTKVYKFEVARHDS